MLTFRFGGFRYLFLVLQYCDTYFWRFFVYNVITSSLSWVLSAYIFVHLPDGQLYWLSGGKLIDLFLAKVSALRNVDKMQKNVIRNTWHRPLRNVATNRRSILRNLEKIYKYVIFDQKFSAHVRCLNKSILISEIDECMWIQA